ncbi:uncharacterized protein LOC103044291 [Astyanax mexicanus]|uniref:uncharacterized protein LOC103044291 n=1 Tax=Astyanax mexicanus TaxID=7994 RepID=UPI0020CB663B|nr:uncharacterized protein LOC103044291 [Astyanax mexicanus]
MVFGWPACLLYVAVCRFTMPLGFHLRLALLYFTLLALAEGQHLPATPPTDSSMEPVNEDKTANEDSKNMDNLPNVYRYHFSERTAFKNLSASITADSVQSERPLSRPITSPTSSKHVLKFVYPYPLSGGTTSSRSAKWILSNSSYTAQRFGPVEGGHSVGPNYSNQDQNKGHLTGLNPLPGNQTNGGSQHSGRVLAKSTIQVNERGSIVRGIWHRIKLPESVSSPLVKTQPIAINRYPDGHLEVPTPLLQNTWRPYSKIISNVQATSGTHSVEQVQTDAGTTHQDQATNSKPVTLVRVKPGHASEVHRLFGNTNKNIHNQDTKGQDQFQDVRRTSKSDPIVTRLPTSSSATSRAVFYHPHLKSTDSSVVQSHTNLELSQSKPNSASAASQTVGSTVSTSSASQPAWRYLNGPKMDGDDAKFLGRSPVTVSSSKHMNQPNVEKLDVLENAQKTGTVQWLVVKPNPASNSARAAVYDSIHLSPRTQSSSLSKQNKADVTGSPNSRADREFKFSSQLFSAGSIDRSVQSHEVNPFQLAPTSRSQRFPTFDNYQTGYQTSHSPSSFNFKDTRDSLGWKPRALPPSHSVGGPSDKQLYPPTDHSQYKMKVQANLHLKKSFENPSQTNLSIFFRPNTLHDLRIKEHSETSTKQPVTSSRFQQNTEVSSISGSAVLANGSDQSIENYLSRNSSEISKLTAIDAGKISSLPISAVNSSSPENGTGDVQTSTGNIYSVNESTGQNETPSSSSRPQTATEDKNVSVSESISANVESITPQNGIRHIQAKMMSGLPFPKEALPINPAEKHQQEDEDQTKAVQQLSRLMNATQSSRPTSRVVVVAKHVKVNHKSPNTYEKSQLPIYRSAIIRKKSTNRLLANVSKDETRPENYGTVNVSAELEVQTESSPAETKMDPSYSDLKSTNISTNNNPVQSTDSQQSLNSTQSKFKQIKPLSIKYLDVASSASISIHSGPMINGTEHHSNSSTLPTSTLVPTTTEPISATVINDVTEATHLIEDGIEPTTSVLHSFP